MSRPFKVGEIVVNVKSQKQYKVINVLNSSLHVRKLHKTKVAKHGGEWSSYGQDDMEPEEIRKLTKLEQSLR